jgi:hypothetical protein
MSKRPPSSRKPKGQPNKRQPKQAPIAGEIPPHADAACNRNTDERPLPGMVQRIGFALAAGALAAWLTLLAIIAFAT